MASIFQRWRPVVYRDIELDKCIEIRDGFAKHGFYTAIKIDEGGKGRVFIRFGSKMRGHNGNGKEAAAS